MAIDTTTDLAHAYYDSWKDGDGHFDEARLRSVLASDLVFDGPLAGHRVGVEGFLRGLADFARSITRFQLVAEIRNGDQAAYLYDCDRSGGPATTPRSIHLGPSIPTKRSDTWPSSATSSWPQYPASLCTVARWPRISSASSPHTCSHRPPDRGAA